LRGIAKYLGAELNYSTKVVKVDVENKTVTLEDGRVFEGDVIVGADGIDGITRPIFEAEAPEPFAKMYR
jgi:salicylate hydroxylase